MILPIAFVEPSLEQKSLQLLFFVSAPDRPKLTPEESAPLQAGHLANMNKLHGEGKLFIAGPFGDNLPIRGLCIMDAGSPKNAEQLMQAGDPLVKGGHLLAQAVALDANPAEFVQVKEPYEMGEYWFVSAKKPKKKPSERDQAVIDRLKLGWAARGDLLFWGQTKGRDARTILIFRKMAKDDVAQAVAQLSLSEPDIRPWWTAKGQFRSETR